jgi:hypothetical protein
MMRINSLGAVFSLACAVHCAAMPAVVALLPLASLDATLEWLLATASIALIGTGLWAGARKHGEWSIFVPMLGGAVILLVARHGVDEPAEGVLTMVGSLTLAACTLFNHGLCRDCGACLGRADERLPGR